MKKFIALLCTGAVLTTAFVGLTACEDKEVKLTMGELYTSNMTATVMGAGKTGIVQTNAIKNETTTTYLDGEVYYEMLRRGDATRSECYDKAGTVGYVVEDGTYYSLLTTADNLKAKSDKAYVNQVFGDKTLALAEQIVSAINKKDGVYVTTKHNAVNSARIASEDGVSLGSDGYIQTNYVLDKESYRVLTLERAVVRSNGNTNYFKIEQKVGVSVTDYSGDLANLCAKIQAVKSGQNVRRMDILFNLGTLDFATRQAYAVKGDRFQIDFGKYYTRFYTDAEYKTEYVYADADKDKAVVTLYTKKEFVPADCDFTMLDIVRANDTEWLLQKYDNVVGAVTQGETVKKLYIDENMLYIDTDGVSEGYLKDGSRGYKKIGDTPAIAIVADPVVMKGKVDELYRNPVLDRTLTLQEEIENVEEKGGKLEITTRRVTEGEHFQTVYVVHKSDYLLEKYDVYQMDEQLAPRLVMEVEMQVDAETAPANASVLYAKLTATENVCTVVVIVDPNTADVRVLKAQVVQGDGIEFSLKSEYPTLYTNPECTEVFDGVAIQADTLLYASK